MKIYLMSLNGKVVVITGSTQGIGKGMAEGFALEGANVVIVGRNKKKGKNIEVRIKKSGRNAIFIKTDVTIEEDVNNLFSLVAEKFGKIDVLINNAAITGGELPFYNLPTAVWKKRIDVNLTGVFFCSRAVSNYMIEKRKGRIINISSVYGFSVSPGTSAYSAAKGGVNLLTKSMAVDLAPYNITVNGIAPGAICTERTKKVEINKENNPILNHILLKRQGKIEEITNLALFLASDKSSYINGEIIVVDGGLLSHFPNKDYIDLDN
jgi:NAD(P)-dependent dehydrogenase (short-subunit alcohol dehydrogenase family)